MKMPNFTPLLTYAAISHYSLPTFQILTMKKPRKNKITKTTTQKQSETMALERTLVLLKPCTIQRGLIGDVIKRFEQKGLHIAGLKMMQLDDEILREHYAHLVDRPFFPGLCASMSITPVIALALEGVDAIEVVRQMAGPTNGRKALPGTIRGDYSISNQQNVIHASDGPVTAHAELKRFFKDEEIFEWKNPQRSAVYADDEI